MTESISRLKRDVCASAHVGRLGEAISILQSVCRLLCGMWGYITHITASTHYYTCSGSLLSSFIKAKMLYQPRKYQSILRRNYRYYQHFLVKYKVVAKWNTLQRELSSKNGRSYKLIINMVLLCTSANKVTTIPNNILLLRRKAVSTLSY